VVKFKSIYFARVQRALDTCYKHLVV